MLLYLLQVVPSQKWDFHLTVKVKDFQVKTSICIQLTLSVYTLMWYLKQKSMYLCLVPLNGLNEAILPVVKDHHVVTFYFPYFPVVSFEWWTITFFHWLYHLYNYNPAASTIYMLNSEAIVASFLNSPIILSKPDMGRFHCVYVKSHCLVTFSISSEGLYLESHHLFNRRNIMY